MSDNAISLVPIHPEYVPPPESWDRARGLLASFTPNAERVSATAFEHVHVIHPIQSFERVSCPFCGSEISVGWWEQAVEERSVEAEHVHTDLVNLGVLTGLASLAITTPCCARETTLDSLDYGEFPVGFGRFVLEALNPDSTGLTTTELDALREVLGTPVQQIWTHL
jgi:hypothetical protein